MTCLTSINNDTKFILCHYFRMSYATQLATEAVVVGGVTVGGFLVIQRVMPESGLITQLFATGVAIHLGFEALGFNKWYLKNGAANIL